MNEEIDYYPEATCMYCGKVCDIYEIHRHDNQLWCYCKKCDVDTFHKPINSEDDDYY